MSVNQGPAATSVARLKLAILGAVRMMLLAAPRSASLDMGSPMPETLPDSASWVRTTIHYMRGQQRSSQRLTPFLLLLQTTRRHEQRQHGGFDAQYAGAQADPAGAGR